MLVAEIATHSSSHVILQSEKQDAKRAAAQAHEAGAKSDTSEPAGNEDENMDGEAETKGE